MKSLALLALVTGCSSLVSDPCATGFTQSGRSCLARTDPDDAFVGVDTGSGSGSDGSHGHDARPDATSVVDTAVADAAPQPDATACSLDLQTDPDNCGYCGHVCASGLCSAGVCLGDPVGHVVVIGHDFTAWHAGVARLFGNALALGDHPALRVGWYRGSADEASDAGAHTAAVAGLAAVGRSATHTTLAALPDATALAAIDVLVIESQHGDGDALEAAAAAEASALHAFLVAGGVVVVLDGHASTSDRFAHGAGLVDLGVATDVTGEAALVAAPTDAIAQQVPIPYLAETTSSGFAVSAGAVVIAGGMTVVVHHTVQ